MDLSEYLRPTASLDFTEPTFAAWVREAAGEGTARERAVRLFLRVRDDVRYDPYDISLDPQAFRASATLARRRGYCVTKAILYAAGLRALGVPARLGFADVKNHLATPRLVELMQTDVFAYHGYAEAWLDGRWLKATPAFNATLCAKFGVAPLEFDGEHDAQLQPVNGSGQRFMEYLKDRGTFADFSLESMLTAWKEVYPHLAELTTAMPGGDFEAEAKPQG